MSSLIKKTIVSILLIAFLNLLGCYSFKPISLPVYKHLEEKEGKPDEINVITKDNQEYHFSDSNFHFENDTLYGKEIIERYVADDYIFQQFDRKIAVSEIESMEVDTYDSKSTAIIYGAIFVPCFLIIIVATVSDDLWGDFHLKF